MRNNDWVPVSTGIYPRDLENVQVTFIGYNDHAPHCEAFAYRNEDKWYWSLDDSDVSVEITAWKHSCEPYHEGAETENVREKDIELIEVPAEEYEMDILFDKVYQIVNKNNVPIGVIYLTFLDDGAIYIEWLEILIVFQGKGYLRKIFKELKSIFNKEIRFECSEELLRKYLGIGCTEHGTDDCMELYMMSY